MIKHRRIVCEGFFSEKRISISGRMKKEQNDMAEYKLKKAVKKEKTIVKAYCLGEKNLVLESLIREGLVRRIDENTWRIFSQEATEGEIAYNGDYIKVDSTGRPYPNSREFFLDRHKRIREDGDEYEQMPKAVFVWSLTFGDEICPEIQFLLKQKGLTIHKEDEKKYFQAPLWGDLLTTPRDSVIVFYDVKYSEPDETGTSRILDADFNFVALDEFRKTYDLFPDDQPG